MTRRGAGCTRPPGRDGAAGGADRRLRPCGRVSAPDGGPGSCKQGRLLPAAGVLLRSLQERVPRGVSSWPGMALKFTSDEKTGSSCLEVYSSGSLVGRTDGEGVSPGILLCPGLSSHASRGSGMGGAQLGGGEQTGQRRENPAPHGPVQPSDSGQRVPVGWGW